MYWFNMERQIDPSPYSAPPLISASTVACAPPPSPPLLPSSSFVPPLTSPSTKDTILCRPPSPRLDRWCQHVAVFSINALLSPAPLDPPLPLCVALKPFLLRQNVQKAMIRALYLFINCCGGAMYVSISTCDIFAVLVFIQQCHAWWIYIWFHIVVLDE